MIARQRRWLAALVIGIAVSTSIASVGRPACAADAEAQALFDEGKRLLAHGDIDEACERFERSQRLEPAGGTLLHLARCREDQGRTATAWTHFNEALSAARSAGRKDREQVAAEHLAVLDRRLVRLRVVVPAAQRIAGLTLHRDGKLLDAAGWGVAVPVDPGSHDVEASAPGHKPWRSHVDVRREGTTLDVTIPDLAPDDTAVAPPPPVTPPPPPPPAPPRANDGGTIGMQRTVALFTASVGLVGIGAATYFGLRSSAAHDKTDELCGGPAPHDCPQAGIDEANTARTLGTISTVTFVLGAVALAGGVVLWLTAPSRATAATSLASGRIAF